VSNQKVYQFRPLRASSANCRRPQFDLIRELPDVPVLSETLVSMELTIRQRSVDLAQVSQLVLSDLGATIQILRLAGRECATGGGCLERVEDCISGLGLNECLEAMAKCPITRSARFASVYSAWDRARGIAVISRSVAETLALNVASEDAYLVGLAHGIGTLPEILEWGWISQSGDDSDLAGLRIADAWHLPHCIVEYFVDRVAGETQTQWTTIVDHALELLESRPYALLRDEFI
jgi:hypothetical protein